MEVFSNGAVAQFVCKRQNRILWIDDDTTGLPAFPPKMKVTRIPEKFILTNTIAFLHHWLNELLQEFFRQSIFSLPDIPDIRDEQQIALKQKNQTIVFNTIGQLVPFIDFVKNHPITNINSRVAAADVVEIINNIEKYNSKRDWCVSFSIKAPRFYNGGLIAPGYYRVSWSVQMKDDVFFIIIQRDYVPYSPEIERLYFHYYYEFNTGELTNPNGDDLALFISDAMAYQKYITAELNEIETEIKMVSR